MTSLTAPGTAKKLLCGRSPAASCCYFIATALAGLLAIAALTLSLAHSLQLLFYCVALVIALLASAVYLSTVLGVANLWVAAMCASVFYLPAILPGFETAQMHCGLLSAAVFSHSFTI